MTKPPNTGDRFPNTLPKRYIKFSQERSSLPHMERLHPQVRIQGKWNKAEVRISAWELFFRIFNPEVIIGTTASLTDFLRKGSLKIRASCISTVQIDEASQFPIHALISLGALCPKARCILIGDPKHPEPYADIHLGKELRGYAVGDILRMIHRMI
uniref:RNA helicase n=1 Tax=Caenorhabditis japonica TaxID=281687 RepID=A0A8R1ILA6_CAEJA